MYSIYTFLKLDLHCLESSVKCINVSKSLLMFVSFSCNIVSVALFENLIDDITGSID